MRNRFVLFLFSLILVAISVLLVLISSGWTSPLDFLNSVYSDFHIRVLLGASGGVVLVLGLYLFFIKPF